MFTALIVAAVGALPPCNGPERHDIYVRVYNMHLEGELLSDCAYYGHQGYWHVCWLSGRYGPHPDCSTCGHFDHHPNEPGKPFRGVADASPRARPGTYYAHSPMPQWLADAL